MIELDLQRFAFPDEVRAFELFGKFEFAAVFLTTLQVLSIDLLRLRFAAGRRALRVGEEVSILDTCPKPSGW